MLRGDIKLFTVRGIEIRLDYSWFIIFILVTYSLGGHYFPQQYKGWPDLIYWTLALPQRVGVTVGFSLGILLDALTGTLLGQHALSLSLIAYITLKTHQRVRLFPLWQQSVFVLGMLLLERVLSALAMGVAGRGVAGVEFWLATVVGALLWPWAYFILRDLRRRFRVS